MWHIHTPNQNQPSNKDLQPETGVVFWTVKRGRFPRGSPHPAALSWPTCHFFVQKVARAYCTLWLQFERQSQTLNPNLPLFHWVPDPPGRGSLDAIVIMSVA